nr:baseplate J/gp47 family protein [Cohnella sp. WQ 127256]
MKAVSLVISDYDIKLDDMEKLLDVDNLTGTLLDTYIYQRKGIKRIQATYAIGQLNVTGNGIINQGDLFETVSGIQFMANETKTITGTGTINIKAVVAGTNGNVPSNRIVQMPVTLSGITVVINSQPTHDGYVQETDNNLRERYYIAIRTPATSGNLNHYYLWAKEVPGVGGVKVFPLERGANTVEVVIIDQNELPASQTLIDSVQEYIDPNSEGLGYGQAPIGAYCYVIPAIGLSLDLSVTVTKDTGYTDAQIKSNIESSIDSYLDSIAFVQSYVSYAAIGNAIYGADGVIDYSALTINGGISNINVGAKEVAVLGVVTVA